MFHKKIKLLLKTNIKSMEDVNDYDSTYVSLLGLFANLIVLI